MKHLTLNDIRIPKPDFASSKLPKGQTVSNWLIDWVKHALEYGIADIGDLIPNKEHLASYLGVSTATIQNSIRYGKNLGYFSSKQSIGTAIADFYSKDLKERDDLYHGNIAECKIKKIVIDDGIKLEKPIPPIKELASRTDISQNTIRNALSNLTLAGYLEKAKDRGNRHFWIYKKEFTLSKEELLNGIQDENFTLTHQLVLKIQNYLDKTYKQGEKILPNSAFSNMFNVSIKTVNDAMKALANKKVILARRGKYGTIYLGKINLKKDFISSEKKKLNSDTKYLYAWQKAQTHLKKYIIENHKVDDKLPSIRNLASLLNVSPNTIRRALKSLIQNGNLVSKCGKSGGIFVLDLPQKEKESYQWLAINPDVIKF